MIWLAVIALEVALALCAGALLRLSGVGHGEEAR